MLMANISDLISGNYWLDTFGSAATIAVILIVFAETGLFLGFFLPGDSLLVLAGIYSVHHSGGKPEDPHLNLALLLPGVIVAAIVGSQLGYWLGRRAGDTLFKRADSRFFKQEYVERTREVLEKYGETRAVFISRFLPIVRSFMNPAVGIVKMPQRQFAIINVVSGVVWAGGVTLLGALVGYSVTNIDKFILPVVLLIIISTGVPVYKEIYSAHKASRIKKKESS